MNGRRLIPLMLIIVLAMTSMVAIDSDGDDSGNVGGVYYSHFGDVKNITVNETCVVSLSLNNTNGNYVLVKITKTNDQFTLVSGGGEYPINADDSKAISLEFKPDKDIRQGTYDVGIHMEVWDSLSGSSSVGDTTFKVNVTSIYSNEQYYNKILGIFDNPLPDPLNNVVSTVIITLCMWVVIAMLVSVVIPVVVRFIIKRMVGDDKDLDMRIRIPIFICIMMFGVCNCLHIYGVNETMVSTAIFWTNLIYVPLLAIVVWKIYKAIVYGVLNDMERKSGNMYIYEAVSPLLHTIGKIFIVVVGAAIILSSLGLDLAVIITGAGIAGLAVSLGTKSAFNELFSGITILVTRPFRVGDTIRIDNGGDEMRVENVGILRTEFVNKYNVDHFAIPNSTLASSKIINYTRSTKRYRIYLYINVHVDDDLDKMKRLLREVAEESPNVITDGTVNKPHIRFDKIEDGMLTVRLAVFIDDFDNKGYIYGQLREAILKKFRENGIKAPIERIGITVMNDGGGSDE